MLTMIDLPLLSDTAILSNSLFSAFLLGLMGSGHCLGMCGGISAAFGLQDTKGQNFIFSFNLGRIASYTCLGAFAGFVGSHMTDAAPILGPWLRGFAGLLIITMGLYIAGWWLGLTRLEQWGSHLWKHIQPLTKRLLPVTTYTRATSLGLLWGFLPCGLVYSTLSWAIAMADSVESSLLMLAFGLGTLPSMLISGFAGKQLLARLRQKGIRAIAGGLMIIFGLFTLLSPLQHAGHQGHSDTPESNMPSEHSHH